MSFRSTFQFVILFAFILAVSGAVADAAQETDSSPKSLSSLNAHMKLLLVDSSFIVANERKFIVTPSTVIKDKEGKVIPIRRLVANRQVKIEYYFDKSGNDPIAVLIQQQ